MPTPLNLPKASSPFSLEALNENPPEFNSNSYNFTIILRTEPLKSGTEIGVVYVRDADLVDKNNLVLNFTTDQELFAIVSNRLSPDIRYTMFQIINLKDLDRDTSYPPVFGLDLIVTDLAGNTNKAHVDINVFKITEILQLPDIEWETTGNEQVKSSNFSVLVDGETEKETLVRYRLKLDEGSVVVNQVLHRLRAVAHENMTDSRSIKYKMVSESRLFRVNETTGELFATEAFDKEPRMRSKRTVLFVQAYYESPQENSAPIWSHVAVVEIDLVRRKVPVFVAPKGNSSRVVVGRGGLLDGRVFGFRVEMEGDEVDLVRFKLNASRVLVGEELEVEKDGRIINDMDSDLDGNE